MRLLARVLVFAAALACLPAAAEEPAPRLSVAVMKVAAMQGVSSDLADPVADLLANAIRSLQQYKVFGQADIEAMLGVEETRQKLGCTDTSCLAEIGGALGADLILSGNLSRLGNTLLFNLRLIDPKKVEVTKGVSRKITGGDEGLIDAVPQVVAELFDVVAPVIAETRTGDAPPPPSPPPGKRGTVTVDVRTSIKGAEVYSNGKRLGNAPLLAELQRGTHRFTAKAPGYEGERKMKIRDATTVEITLKALDLIRVEGSFRIDAAARYKEWESSALRAQDVTFGEYVLRTEYPGYFEDYQESDEARSVALAAYLEDQFRTIRNVGIGLTFGVGLGALIAAATIGATACPKKTDAQGKEQIDGDSTCAQATGWTLIPVSAGATAAGIALWVIFQRRANRAEALKPTAAASAAVSAEARLDFRLTPLLDARGVPGGLGLSLRF